MKKIFLFLFTLSTLLFLASFFNQNKALADCIPDFCSVSPCSNRTDGYTQDGGACTTGGPQPFPGRRCCTPGTSGTELCSALSGTINNIPVTYACKDACAADETDSYQNICPGSQRCCSKATINGAGGALCTSGNQCLSGTCTEGRCVPGTAEIVCRKLGTNSEPNFTCRTAIGPINTSIEGFSKSVLQLLLGLAGGILLVMIIINGYKIMTSQGDPEKIKDAREGIIAAIAGILLIIFSVSILQLITVDIIGLPGFTR